mmetsp:Transcript_24300/g.51125  ORF Transcript_24300/g.51125 Transcript_24300/m.51125 type:complete len:189 (+) Transcript_24300:381-947(+)
MNTILEGSDEDSVLNPRQHPPSRAFLIPETNLNPTQSPQGKFHPNNNNSLTPRIPRNFTLSPRYSHRPHRRSSLTSYHGDYEDNNDYDAASSSEESIETMMSSELYSLRNYSPKKRRTKKSLVEFSYVTCCGLMGEVKESLDDAVCALEQVWSVFTITQADLDAIDVTLDEARIEFEEKILEMDLLDH